MNLCMHKWIDITIFPKWAAFLSLLLSHLMLSHSFSFAVFLCDLFFLVIYSNSYFFICCVSTIDVCFVVPMRLA